MHSASANSVFLQRVAANRAAWEPRVHARIHVIHDMVQMTKTDNGRGKRRREECSSHAPRKGSAHAPFKEGGLTGASPFGGGRSGAGVQCVNPREGVPGPLMPLGPRCYARATRRARRCTSHRPPARDTVDEALRSKAAAACTRSLRARYSQNA